MKKVFLLPLFAAIFLVACTKVQTPSDSKSPAEINFSVKMDSHATKATDTSFENGDEMNLLAIWGDQSLDIRKATYQNGKISLDKTLCWPEKAGWKDANFVMIYPYFEGYTEENIGQYIYGSKEVFFTVKADQSTHALYTSSDLIVGGCYELQEKDAPCTVNLTLEHMLSQVRIIITNKSDFGIKDVYLSNVYGKFDLNNETVSGSKGTIKTCNSGNGQWTCVIPPQTGEPAIHITTTDNKEIKFNAPSEIHFYGSERTNLLLTLNDDTEVSDFSYEIVNWDPGEDFNYSQNEWESLGTGQIRDWYFEDEYFPVEIEQNRDNPRSFRIVNPYSGIKQAYYPESESVPDDYLYFRIFDKGEEYNGYTVTRDNYIMFDPCATGYFHPTYNSEITICHPTIWNYHLSRWKKSRVVWFQSNGLPGQINISPLYFLNPENRAWDFTDYEDMISILFPGCDERQYKGALEWNADDGIIKENGKVYLSFYVEKKDPDVNSMRFSVLDGQGFYYSDFLDMEDGLIDSYVVSEDRKSFLIEIPDNYAIHTVIMETYGDGYPQYRYSRTFHDNSADFDDWKACGKGTYYGIFSTEDGILYNSKTNDLNYMIKPWLGDCLPFSTSEDDKTIKIEQSHFTGVYYKGYPVYISDYTSVDPSAESGYFYGAGYHYYGEGIGTFKFNPYYYTSQGALSYGSFETFQLSGNEVETKASLVLKSAAEVKKSERANLEDFSEGGVNLHLHSAARPTNLQKMPE